MCKECGHNPCKKDNPKHRKHTEITSKSQQGLFGAELARRRAGKSSRMSGITTEELKSHLKESKGKTLPKYSKGKKAELARRKK